MSCLEALRVEAGHVGGREGEGEPGGEQEVVVVWASDHDTLAQSLLEQLVANPHVSVVRLEHYLRDESVGRMDDRHVSSSSYDMHVSSSSYDIISLLARYASSSSYDWHDVHQC